MSTHHATPHMTPTELRTMRLGLTLGMVAAGLLSLDGQRRLAEAVGWHGWYAYLLPVGVEIFAGMATRLWAKAPTPAARARALRQVLVAVGLSAALNVVWHLADHGVMPIGWPVVVGVALVPPLVVALTVHLAAGIGTPAEPPANPSETPAEETEQPEVSAPRATTRVSQRLIDIAAAALAAADDPRTITGVELHRRHGSPSVRAWQKALAAAREQAPQQAAA